MPRITFLPSQASVDAAPGEDLLDVAARAGVRLESECGGEGVCGSCLVFVEQGALDAERGPALPLEAAEEGAVLACLAKVGQVDCAIRTATGSGAGQGVFARAAGMGLVERLSGLSPLVFRKELDVPPAAPLDGLSDADRVERALCRETGASGADFSLESLRGLARAVRVGQGMATVTAARVLPGEDRLLVLDAAPGRAVAPLLGAACDLGTTSVSVRLLDLDTGRANAVFSDYNAQVRCGLDVISRINYARKPGRLDELRSLALDTINKLLAEAAESAHVEPKSIAAVSLSGNTVMTHLLLGLDPEHIRLDPYTPTVLRPGAPTARDVGLEVNPQAPVLLAPGVGSYVGGDIVSGLLCTDIQESDAVQLFIDIGTNGEAVLGNRDFLMGCACSAGPAFEGGELSCGMRAAPGAVERAHVDPATGEAECSVVAGAETTGICGSGVITLLAGLFKAGWLDPAGKFDKARACRAVRTEGRKTRYVLAGSGQGEVFLTEQDVEHVIRAKAAIYSGCALLLEQAGLDFADVSRVTVAGGFGRSLDVEAAIAIGLLPDLPRDRFAFVGNASLTGSGLALLSRAMRRKRDALAARMTYVDLSNAPGYMDQYTGALFLPHTDAARFPSVRPVS